MWGNAGKMRARDYHRPRECRLGGGGRRSARCDLRTATCALRPAHCDRALRPRELFFLSDRVSAEEALRLGLTNWVCAPEQLAASTREIAQRLSAGPTVAYRYMKENLNRALGGEVDDCLDLEATHQIHCGQTEDHREAARAFVEKREPVFNGR